MLVCGIQNSKTPNHESFGFVDSKIQGKDNIRLFLPRRRLHFVPKQICTFSEMVRPALKMLSTTLHLEKVVLYASLEIRFRQLFGGRLTICRYLQASAWC
jgi:hypothetical protein